MPPKSKAFKVIDQSPPVRRGGASAANGGGSAAVVNVVPPANPLADPPENLTLETAVYRADCVPISTITASWTAPIGREPALYLVQYSQDSGFAIDSTFEIVSADVETTIGGVDAAALYYVRVAAITGGQRSAWCDPASITAADSVTAGSETLILLPTLSVSPGGVYVWKESTATWSLSNSGLPSGAAWGAIAADPADPLNHWALAIGDSTDNILAVSGGNITYSGSHCVYVTADGGATWSGITPTVASPHHQAAGNTIDKAYLTDIEFDPSGNGEWVAFGLGGKNFDYRYWAIRGNDSAASVTQSYDPSAFRSSGGAGDLSENGDVIGLAERGGGINLDRLMYGAGSTLSAYSESSFDRGRIARIPGSPLAAVIATHGVTAGSQIWATSDYTSAAPTARITSSGGQYVSVGATIGILVGGRSGVGQVSDLFGTPSISTIHGSGTNVNRVRADRQAGTHAAARIALSDDFFLYDGAIWSTLSGPGVAYADLSDWHEVVRSVPTSDCIGCPPNAHHANHEIGGCDALLLELLDGQVTTDQIADGAVTIAKLSFDPATQTELDSEATTRAAADTALAAPQYLTLALSSTLANERRLVAGSGISITDGGANGDATIAATGGVTTLDGLTDVQTAGEVSGVGLFYDGSVWRPAYTPTPLLLEDGTVAILEDGTAAMSEPAYI